MAHQQAIVDCLRELSGEPAGGSGGGGGSSAYPLPWLLLDLHRLLREAAPAQPETKAHQQAQLYTDLQTAAEDRRQGIGMAARLFTSLARSGGRSGRSCGQLADLLCRNENMLELFIDSREYIDVYAEEAVSGAV